jgi:CO/xanthine dehydrogenase Mo-binding subunit
MKTLYTPITPDTYDEPVDRVEFHFDLSRRDFLQMLGAGLLILVAAPIDLAQVPPGGGGNRQGGRGRGGGGFGGSGPKNLAARLHINKDGLITVMTSKVECGQGSRAEITQAAAEELRVPLDRVTLIMADTGLCPDDGMTAGSGTTPRTLPSVRQGCAAARQLLVDLAAKRWNVADKSALEVRDAKVIDKTTDKELTYADLANADDATELFAKPASGNVAVTTVKDWKIQGADAKRPNGRDLVTGQHHYPSDITRPGMLHAKVLRPPGYGAKLTGVDLAPAKAMADVVAVQDGAFVGVAASTTHAAEAALEAVAKTAQWEKSPHVSSKEIYEHLARHARNGIPENPFASEVAKAEKSLKQTYHVAYVQHAPMEPRAAVAEWTDGKLTVWTATQNPFGVKGELARAFNLAAENVRVIVPDFGGGFGGKHSGECAVECARLAMAAKKPVSLRWTRAEEFTWAYFRPAALIEAQASLDAQNNLATWHYVNINSGGNAVESPYRIPKSKSQFVGSEPPLRHGSYRALASTANVFGRECFMDEMAALAGRDPLEFRLAHLDSNSRLRAVLEEAAKQFEWNKRKDVKQPNLGIGLACGVEKGSYVAACVEVAVDPKDQKISVRRVVQAYDCGAVVNPAGLVAQNQGAIIMALGPALREEVRFDEEGKVLTDAFSDYLVPRFTDVPQIEVHLVNRPDTPSAGAGETPIIATAPAIANAVFNATGQRVREMPMKLQKLQV